ncbi:MAG: helix-turn-helix domain-containing protein [Microbacterium sp.]
MRTTMDTKAMLSVHDLPSVSAGPLSNDRLLLFLWVRKGAAAVAVAGRTHAVSAGEAIVVPPGVVHTVHTDRASLAIPVFAPATMCPAALTEVRIVPVPVGWEEWLMHRYAAAEVTRVTALQQLLGDSVPAGRPGEVGGHVASLPMPHSPQARSVARTILRAPGADISATVFAQREHISVKTLQRRFRNETGLQLSEWRTRARVAAAAACLAEGRGVGWSGRHVGYTSAAGFTRAFRRHAGITPQEFIRRAARDGAPAYGFGSDVFEGVSDIVMESHSAPPIPAERRPVQIENRHILHWIYRGRATLRIGAHDRQLRRGDVIWTPAGVPFQVRLDAGAILLPLGSRHGPGHVAPEDLRTFPHPPETEDHLLHIALAEETLLRPAAGPGTFVDALFRAQFGRHQDDVVPAAPTSSVAKIGAALWHSPDDARSLAEWAGVLGVRTSELSREFSTQTGMAFPRWRSRLRMDVARALLWTGGTPGDVARQLGYTSTSTFTKVFSATHGVPPKEYQRREAAI